MMTTQIPTAEELMQRARDLQPVLRARSDQAQRERRIPVATMNQLKEAGLFRVLQPRRWGGYALAPQVFYEIQMVLAEACMSTAWVYGVVGVHNWQMGLFPLPAQQDVWRHDSNVLIASSYMPVGKAIRVDGGFKFSGHWGFSSGSDHAEWVFLGGGVQPTPEQPQPDFRTFLLPRTDFTLIDTWHTLGLRGTGSHDVVVEDAVVPEHRTHKMLDGFRCRSPGPDCAEEPLYQLPFGQVFTRAISTASIGALQGAIDAFRQLASKRIGVDGGRTAEDPHGQMAIAAAQSLVDQLKLKMLANFDQLMRDAKRGVITDIAKRSQYRYEAAAVPEQCLDAVLELQKFCGGRAIFLDAKVQQFVVDILASRAHAGNNLYKYGRNFGAIQLGLDNADYFL